MCVAPAAFNSCVIASNIRAPLGVVKFQNKITPMMAFLLYGQGVSFAPATAPCPTRHIPLVMTSWAVATKDFGSMGMP